MRRRAVLVSSLLVAAVLAGCGGGEEAVDAGAAPTPQDTPPELTTRPGELADDSGSPTVRVPGVTTSTAFSEEDGAEGLGRWRADVPTVRDVRIESSADGATQPALYVPPADPDGEAPLLVVLHSWSSDYLQTLGIPYGRWARRNGWAMTAPNFRGVNDDPQATGSDLAVQDVLDAVDDAVDRGGVDAERVFVVGFSGGGHMALNMAGRHPDRFAGIASWVPVHDLERWYAYNRDEQTDTDYVEQLESSCGGDPTSDADAERSCDRRSPSRWLPQAREAGVPVYIGAGIADETVPADHALRAFDQLAAPQDRLGAEAIAAAAEGRLADGLRGSIEAETRFSGDEPEVLLARSSGPVTLAVFDGEHEMVFHPGLEWMSRLAEE